MTSRARSRTFLSRFCHWRSDTSENPERFRLRARWPSVIAVNDDVSEAETVISSRWTPHARTCECLDRFKVIQTQTNPQLVFTARAFLTVESCIFLYSLSKHSSTIVINTFATQNLKEIKLQTIQRLKAVSCCDWLKHVYSQLKLPSSTGF